MATRLDAAKAVAPYTNPRLAVIDSTVKLAADVTVTLTPEERRQRARAVILEAFRERPPRVIEGQYRVVAGNEVPAEQEKDAAVAVNCGERAKGEASEEREG
jgi:hypothetical protein